MASGRHQRLAADELRPNHAVDPGTVRYRLEARLQRAFHHPGQAMRRGYLKQQRSQGLTEFALIAPVLLLLTFGIIDFGRGLYFYITLQQAANEGARVAVRASYFIDPNGSTHQWPTDADVATAVQQHAVTENLANPCPNGPIPNNGNPVGSPCRRPPTRGGTSTPVPSLPGTGPRNGPGA